MSHLPAIYLINLDRSSKRLELFGRRNPHLSEVTRYPAIDGAAVDRSALLRNGVILEDCPYSAGSLGCSLSHISLWRQAWTDRRPITVFEDDVVVSARFEETTARLLSGIPSSWDFVLWGYPVHERLPIWIDCDVGRARINWYQQHDREDLSEFQGSNRSHTLFKLLNCWGAQAYSVSPTGAGKLLDECVPLRNRVVQFSQPGISYRDEAIDGPMNAAYPSMQAFICFPPLVMHDENIELDRTMIDRH